MKWRLRRHSLKVTPWLLNTVDALMRADGKKHCWDLAVLGNEQVPNVHRAIERLRDAGWVVYEWEPADEATARPRRRLWQLTEQARGQAGDLLRARGRDAG